MNIRPYEPLFPRRLKLRERRRLRRTRSRALCFSLAKTLRRRHGPNRSQRNSCKKRTTTHGNLLELQIKSGLQAFEDQGPDLYQPKGNALGSHPAPNPRAKRPTYHSANTLIGKTSR
jgi:hypothetical protein